MSVHEQEREALKKVYPSKKWIEKVNKMTDKQVFAIYTRLKLQNKI